MVKESTFEPSKKTVSTIQLEDLWKQNPSVLGRWDDVRQTDWVSEIKYPEITLQQTQELLSIV